MLPFWSRKVLFVFMLAGIMWILWIPSTALSTSELTSSPSAPSTRRLLWQSCLTTLTFSGGFQMLLC